MKAATTWTGSQMISRQAKGARFSLKMKRKSSAQNAMVAGLVRLYLFSAGMDAGSIVARLEEVLGEDGVSDYLKIIHHGGES